MARSVKSRAWVEDVETYPTAEGFGIILECRTPEMKRFSVTLRCSPRAPQQSVAGRNLSLIEKMLSFGGITAREHEVDHFDWKRTAARVRHGFYWFKLDVDKESIFLRDVRPCEPFSIEELEVDIEEASAMIEALAAGARDVP